MRVTEIGRHAHLVFGVDIELDLRKENVRKLEPCTRRLPVRAISVPPSQSMSRRRKQSEREADNMDSVSLYLDLDQHVDVTARGWKRVEEWRW